MHLFAQALNDSPIKRVAQISYLTLTAYLSLTKVTQPISHLKNTKLVKLKFHMRIKPCQGISTRKVISEIHVLVITNLVVY